MSPATRTPEGWYQCCPICKKDVILEPSSGTFDAPCPHCGHLLWFDSSRKILLIRKPKISADVRKTLIRLYAARMSDRMNTEEMVLFFNGLEKELKAPLTFDEMGYLESLKRVCLLHSALPVRQTVPTIGAGRNPWWKFWGTATSAGK